ncbi:hypothetical protein ACSFCT_09400 [Yokenella regensburgei]|uniref:hypothetical protein n=1 Tax=Yokenella regensburgei TaxID=158877 RepID=UPI003EDA3CE2
MTKLTKNDGAQGAPELMEEKDESATTIQGPGTDTGNAEDGDDNDQHEEDGEEEEAAADDKEGEGLLVVVCKGHTLWHNGEKYPQFQRLRMDDGDADRLLKRGVVVRYADLLKKVSDHAG